MKRVSLVRLLLIFCLLFAQLGGFAHALSHLHGAETHSQDERPESAGACADCLAFAGTSAALPACAPPGECRVQADLSAGGDPLTHAPTAVGVYRSRAPPLPAR